MVILRSSFSVLEGGGKEELEKVYTDCFFGGIL